MKLTCNSCHPDINGASGTEPALSGNHAGHLGDGVIVPGRIKMNSANDAGCVNCHPNNTGQGKASIDNGTVKAYPHSSDGTNVVPDNVTLQGNISNPVKSGTNTTCTSACHPRSSTNTNPSISIKWGSALNCNMCHYYESNPSSSHNDADSTGKLDGQHDLHFDRGCKCTDCHVTTIPSSIATHVKYSGFAGISSMPPKSGNSGLVPGLKSSYTGGPAGTCDPGNSNFPCHMWGGSKHGEAKEQVGRRFGFLEAPGFMLYYIVLAYKFGGEEDENRPRMRNGREGGCSV